MVMIALHVEVVSIDKVAKAFVVCTYDTTVYQPQWHVIHYLLSMLHVELHNKN